MSGDHNFFVITFFTLISYCASLMFVKNRTITLVRHRRFWNWILLVSFFISGIFGMLMSFMIDSDIKIGFYGTILWFHVEMGIVMAVVSVFHLLWHRQYFVRKRLKV
ncbi:MAG: hypothetical protein PHI66_04540 [Candidatus Pacebacteria bacterium]|nr:hypothetical protein [Candidatus Paceibacterota bacterium]